MWPWGHLAIGYLFYSLGLRRQGRLPDSPEVFLVAFGTLFPDLVDKPFSWTFGILNSGRSLGHSVLVAAFVIVILYALVAPRIGRSKITAFVVGWLSHLFADLPFRGLIAGNLEHPTYLLWPVLTEPTDETGLTVITYILTYDYGPWEVFEFALFGIAAVVWIIDGKPGLDRVRYSVRS